MCACIGISIKREREKKKEEKRWRDEILTQMFLPNLAYSVDLTTDITALALSVLF